MSSIMFILISNMFISIIRPAKQYCIKEAYTKLLEGQDDLSRSQFGIYTEDLTSDDPSKLENLTKTTEFSDIYKNVYIHIDVYGQSSGLQTIKLTQFETYLS